MPSDRKTTMNAYQRFPQKWKTLGVRWPNRHGVTAPLSRWHYHVECSFNVTLWPSGMSGDRPAIYSLKKRNAFP